MSEREEFYRRRDLRVEQYLGGDLSAEKQVCVGIDADAAATRAGQLLLLSLANQLVRVHRQVQFVVPALDLPLLMPSPFAAGTLGRTLLNTCTRIDPYGMFPLVPRLPANTNISIAIGEHTGPDYDWYLGAENAVAYLDRIPCPLRTEYKGTIRGAALASCLGAAAVIRAHLGLNNTSRRLSVWNYREGDAAAPGPTDLQVLDVGRVLMVGAGAVGSALAYWLYMMGVAGSWSVIDRDQVELHNTSRCLLFTPVDAGWPEGAPAYKSKVVSRFLPVEGEVEPAWYHESEVTRERFDVVLCLANEWDVRTRIANRHAPIVLHATTGENWLSQLHRHIPGRDDCIRCRTHDIRDAHFKCSTAQIKENAEAPSRDAALPFLSAASGLMLATALQRLQHGDLAQDPWNDWRWYFDSPRRMASGGFRRCLEGVCSQIPAAVRHQINAGTRWASLDRAS